MPSPNLTRSPPSPQNLTGADAACTESYPATIQPSVRGECRRDKVHMDPTDTDMSRQAEPVGDPKVTRCMSLYSINRQHRLQDVYRAHQIRSEVPPAAAHAERCS